MTDHSPFSSRQLTKNDLILTLLVFVFATILICLFNYRNIQIVFARFDDLALIAAASDHPVTWFTKGFSDYFQVYPEFTIATTNFIRPVANGMFWLFSAFGLDQRPQLIATNYALHALNTSSVFLFARWRGASTSRALVFSATFLLTATFWYSQSLLYPAFGPDQLVLTFIIITVFAVYSNKIGLAFIASLLAVLTKETALPVLAAIAVYGFYSRRLVYTVMSGLIIYGYFALRSATFSGATTGIYAFVSLDDPRLFSIARLVALLPVGPPKAPLAALDLADNMEGINQIYFVMNALIWCAIAIAIFHPTVRRSMVSHIRNRDASGLLIALIMIGFASSYAYFYLIGTLDSLRFGYVAMWFLMLLFGVLHRFKAAYLAACFVLIGNLSVVGMALYQNEQHATLRHFISNGSQSLISFVAMRKDREPLYLVNDFSTAYTRTSDIARLAGAQIDFQRGSSIDIERCVDGAWKLITTSIERLGKNHIRITSRYPDCVKIRFESVSAEKMMALSQGNRIVRNSNISYEFYRDDVPVTLLNPMAIPANQMVIELRNVKAVYFDFIENMWRVMD